MEPSTKVCASSGFIIFGKVVAEARDYSGSCAAKE